MEMTRKDFLKQCMTVFHALQTNLAGQTGDPTWAYNVVLELLIQRMVYAMLRGVRWQEDDIPVLFKGKMNDCFITGIEAYIKEIDNLLNHYRFTLREERADQESIGPEMLGEVYERLAERMPNSKNEWEEMGIFYTARTEIDLMCRLVLVDYLSKRPGLEKGLLYDALFAREGEEQATVDTNLFREGLWQPITTLLREITIIDPACGAGAFLVQMLFILDDLQARAGHYLGNAETACERRKCIISRNLYGTDVKEWAVWLTKLRLWLATLATCPHQQQSLAVQFHELEMHIHQGDSLLESGEKRYNIVIGNPPYVRQEQITAPTAALDKRVYKAAIACSLYRAFPIFFGYNPETGKVRRQIDAKSDLYLYFFFLGLSLLQPKGSLCFITSNAWLDTAYGAELRAFLLGHCHLTLVLDSQTRRSFCRADINTVITLCSAPVPDIEHTLAQTARFVMSNLDLAQLCSAGLFKGIESAMETTMTPQCRIVPLQQQRLLARGMSPTQGSNWGRYLRAPDIYWTILSLGREKLVRLGEIATIRRGYTTGANEFFYLDETRARQWSLEEEFLRPALKSPRTCQGLLLDPHRCRLKLFQCHKDKEALRGTAALDYITWGESQSFHLRPSCAARLRWWDIGSRPVPHLLFNYLIDTTARTFYIPEGCYGSDNFQEVHPSPGTLLSLCASLNSTLFQLLVNVTGRVNFGDGLLKIQTSELANLHCPSPALIPLESDRLFSTVCWDVTSPSPERLALDNMIFDALGLTQGERDAVYEGVTTLVQTRVKKAKTPPESINLS